MAHREELYGAVRDWVRGHTDLDGARAHAGSTQGSPWASSARVREVAASDWAIEARARSPRCRTVGGGTIRIPNSPWRFSAASARARGVPAYRGEHNREVLAELLGLDDRGARPPGGEWACCRVASPRDIPTSRVVARRPDRRPVAEDSTVPVPLPYDIAPMKAVLGELPTDADGWAYEIKWDGMRALTFIDDGVLSMRSTRRLELADRFPELGRPGGWARRPPGRARRRGRRVRRRAEQRLRPSPTPDARRRPVRGMPPVCRGAGHLHRVRPAAPRRHRHHATRPTRNGAGCCSTLSSRGRAWQVPAHSIGDGQALLGRSHRAPPGRA